MANINTNPSEADDSKGPKLDEHLCDLLKTITEEYWDEDRAVRERQIRQYRHLKLLWEGFSRVYWSEVAHDWRVYDIQTQGEDTNQEFYDKPMNVFRAYLETIIAALSVLVPPVKCYPDDADNPLDLLTAKAGDKIGQLIFRHNDAPLLWLQGLFIYCTEGLVACYTYPKESYEYGEYEEPKYDEVEEMHEYQLCSVCQEQLADKIVNEAEREDYGPGEDEAEIHAAQDMGMVFCPNCEAMVAPEVTRNNLTIQRLVGITRNPKSRVCQEVYGGLYVKVPNYARKVADCPYLIQSYETNYAVARERFPWIRSKIQPNSGANHEIYERWGRQNPAYQGDFPENNVTIRNAWLRPSAYQVLSELEDVEKLKKKFPDGVRVTFVNEHVAEYENENLDDCWTLTCNPLSDFVTFDPLGLLLTSVQEITNDITSLTLQTIEHGIPQTFADENVLDFKAYSQMETTPGAIYPAKPRSGKSIGDGFYEIKTATLSQEILPFFQMVQSLGQTIVGAQPSLFGGDIQGSKTASEYSMSRAQALQRLQNTWKMFTAWWKAVQGKSINIYIKEMRDDEKFVTQDDNGNFINTFIRKAELEGKIGNIELESNENLPITWSQQRDLYLQMMEANNPAIWQYLSTPENLPLVYSALGIPDLTIPGESSRNKQYEEIKQLIVTEPIIEQPDEAMIQQAAMMGQPPPPPMELPSIDVEEFDNHQVELDTCITWINSETGQLAKQEQQPGYMNVVLHARMHKAAMMQQVMEQQMMGGMGGGAQGAAPLPNPEPNLDAPMDTENVPVN